MRTHINIGSNLGNRLENINQAVASLRRLAFDGCDNPDFRVSDFIESEPWGFDSPNGFLNVGVSFETILPPLHLLDAVQQIEKSISDASHRNADGSYSDRIIDIDIIIYGDIRMCGDRLTLPHPRAAQRDFVTRPLQQIDPELCFMLDLC